MLKRYFVELQLHNELRGLVVIAEDAGKAEEVTWREYPGWEWTDAYEIPEVIEGSPRIEYQYGGKNEQQCVVYP